MRHHILPNHLSLWHFLILTGVMFSHALNTGATYRFFLYVNVIVVIYYWRTSNKSLRIFDRETLLKASFAPALFIIFHTLSVGSLELTKEMRGMVTIMFFALGIHVFSKLNTKPKSWFILTATLILTAYTLIQGIVIFIPGSQNGTTKNPHYLAQYCLLLLPVAAYLFSVSSHAMKALLASCAVGLLAMLIQTASRPAWIGLFFSCALFILHQNGKKKILSLAVITAIFTSLYIANIGSFGDKLHDLYTNVQKEERVYIWHDALAMQQQSSPRQWLFGHGLRSFTDDFKAYSVYHDQGIDFTGPHNFVIELLYLSGILGLLTAAVLVAGMYFGLIKHYLRQDRSAYVLMLIAVFTSHLVLVSITIPFFASYSLIILGLIGGLLLSLGRTNRFGVST